MITVLNFQKVQEVVPLKWFVSFSEENKEHLILWPIAVFFGLSILRVQPMGQSICKISFDDSVLFEMWMYNYYDCQWLVFGSILCLVLTWNIIFGELQRRQCGEWVRGLMGDKLELVELQSSKYQEIALRFMCDLNVNLAICTLILCECMLFCWCFGPYSVNGMGEFLAVDETVWIMQLIGSCLILGPLVVARLCQVYIRNEFVYLCYFLFLFTLLVFLCTDWVGFIIAAEGIAFSLYVFAILQDSRAINFSIVKASEQYILFGIFASGVLIFGVSIIYGATGLSLFDWMPLWVFGFFETNRLFVVGIMLFLIGWFFKVSMVPLHSWIVPVYTSVNDLIVMLFAIYTKTIFVLILIGKFSVMLSSSVVQWWLFFCGAVSMVVGTIGGLSQVNIKGLLAYSAISNIGLVGLVLSYNTTQAIWLAVGYILCYALTVLSIFIGLFAFRPQFDGSVFLRSVYDYQSSMLLSPMLSLWVVLAFVALMGLPPFVLFVFKVLALFVVINFWLSIVVSMFVVVISVLGIVYYVRLLREIFFYNEVIKHSMVEGLMFNWPNKAEYVNLFCGILVFLLMSLTIFIFILFLQ